MKQTLQPKISPSRAATLASDFSGSRPTCPKMMVFQPCCRQKSSVPFIERRRISPSPTLAPGLASTSPRMSTGVPLGRSASDFSRGIASRYLFHRQFGHVGVIAQHAAGESHDVLRRKLP